MVGHFPRATLQRREDHEEIGDAVRWYSSSCRSGCSGFAGIGLRVSMISCFEVSSKRTSVDGSRGLW